MFTTTDFDAMSMNVVAINNSQQAYMLTDLSEFLTSSHIAYTSIGCLYTVVTGNEISPEI